MSGEDLVFCVGCPLCGGPITDDGDHAGLNRVFIVTQGEYEDYQILAVFTTREAAERYAGARLDTGGLWGRHVEEFGLCSSPEDAR